MQLIMEWYTVTLTASLKGQIYPPAFDTKTAFLYIYLAAVILPKTLATE